VNPPNLRRFVLAALLAGSTAQAGAQSSISITAIDRASAATFALITINGNGFDSAAALSVVFTARDVITVTVPAITATSTAVRVAVPALIHSGSGLLLDTPVVADIQVVQVTSASVITSNTLGGFTIEPAPQAAGPAGTFTRAFLRTILDVQSDFRTARQSTAGFGDAIAASRAFTDAQAPLLAAVETVLRSPEANINLSSQDNVPVAINARTLRTMDRMGTAFIQQSNGRFSTSPGTVSQTACTCNPISELDRSLCEFRQYACSAYDPSRKVVAEGAIGAYAVEFSLLGSWTAGGLSSTTLAGSETAGGLGFLVSQVFAYMTAVLAGVEPPGASSLLRDTGTSLLEDLTNNGLGVFTGLQIATQLTQTVENVVLQTRGPLPSTPQGGLVLPAPVPASPPANTRPTRIYGTGVGPKWIATPVNQGVTTVTAATLPAPAVARFNGSYAGSSSISCTIQTPDGPFTTGGSGPAAGTVLNGVITSDGNTGRVSDTGRFTAPYVAAGGVGCSVGGRFWTDPSGAAGANGFIACSGDGLSCSGSWGLTRSR
jgi:hypothetical protein